MQIVRYRPGSSKVNAAKTFHDYLSWKKNELRKACDIVRQFILTFLLN